MDGAAYGEGKSAFDAGRSEDTALSASSLKAFVGQWFSLPAVGVAVFLEEVKCRLAMDTEGRGTIPHRRPLCSVQRG